jgi:hypothetical protein
MQREPAIRMNPVLGLILISKVISPCHVDTPEVPWFRIDL